LHVNPRIVFTLASSFIFLYSCTFTPMLYKTRPYVEEVSTILVSANNKNIIVLSPRYHYIIDAPPIIVNSLKSNYASKVKVQFDQFSVGTSQCNQRRISDKRTRQSENHWGSLCRKRKVHQYKSISAKT